MQGQRGIGSFTETLDINHTSASSSAVGQQVCWNNVQNAAENRLSSCIIAPDEIGITYINPSGQERQNVSRLSFGEPGSSSSQNEVGWNEQKGDHIWSSSVSPFARNSLSLETRRIEPSNHLSLDGSTANPMIRENSTQNINLNADYMASGSRNCPPDLSKSTRTENEPFQAPWSGGYLEEDYEDRIGFPPEGRRSSCKRKSPEVNVGESSTSGSRRYFQHGETSARPGVANGSASNLSMSAPSEQVDPRINVQPQGFAYDSLQNSTSAGSAESSHRNFRMRINPSSQPESGPPPLFPTGNAFRLASSSSSQRSSRLVPVDNSFNLRSAPGADRITQSQLALIHLHAPPRSVQPFRWGSASVSGPGSSSSSVVSENRDAPFEESSSRGMGRNLLDHPRLSPATEMRHLVQNPTHRSSVSGNLSAPGHIASASRTGTSSVVPSDPPFVPPANPPSRYPRRLSEYVRRSLFSSIGTESGGQSGSHPPLRSGPSSPEMLQAPGANNQDQHQPSVRSTSWMGRQGDGVLAMPHPLRNAVASGEGRRGRLVSEIRSVLDLMRRGEGLRFEDVMILDQSVLFNIADIHDRHRDMRLDVDNMSYEELLALEERIGNVSTGLSEEKILGKLEQRKYSDLEPDKKQEEPCCICQEEYNNEEDIGKLDCGHIFHRECIKQWLTHKNLCPICKTTGLAT